VRGFVEWFRLSFTVRSPFVHLPGYQASHSHRYLNLNGNKSGWPARRRGRKRLGGVLRAHGRRGYRRNETKVPQTPCTVSSNPLNTARLAPVDSTAGPSSRSSTTSARRSSAWSDLQPYHVENWLNEYHQVKRREAGSERTSQSSINVQAQPGAGSVQRGFQWAENQGYLSQSPLRKVKRPASIFSWRRRLPCPAAMEAGLDVR